MDGFDALLFVVEAKSSMRKKLTVFAALALLAMGVAPLVNSLENPRLAGLRGPNILQLTAIGFGMGGSQRHTGKPAREPQPYGSQFRVRESHNSGETASVARPGTMGTNITGNTVRWRVFPSGTFRPPAVPDHVAANRSYEFAAGLQLIR